MNRLLFFAIIVLFASCGYEFDPKVDNSISLVIAVDGTESDQVNYHDVVSKRVTQFGVDFVLSPASSELILTVPEFSDVDRIRQIIQSKAKIEIKPVPPKEELEGILETLNERIRNSLILDKSIEYDTTVPLASWNPLFNWSKHDLYGIITKGQLGVFSPRDTTRINSYLAKSNIKNKYPVEFKWGADFAITETEFVNEAVLYAVYTDNQNTLLNEDILNAKATAKESEERLSNVSMQLTKTGGDKFYELTKSMIGEHLAIMVNDLVITSPVVGAPIEGGKVEISGPYTENEVQDLAAILNSGNFNATVRIIDEVVNKVE